MNPHFLRRAAGRLVAATALAASLLFSRPAAAQTAPPSGTAAETPMTTEERLKRLEQLLAETRSELAAMKAAGTADAATAAKLAELDRRMDILSREIEKMKIGEAAAPVSPETYGVGPAAAKVYAKDGLSIG